MKIKQELWWLFNEDTSLMWYEIETFLIKKLILKNTYHYIIIYTYIHIYIYMHYTHIHTHTT